MYWWIVAGVLSPELRCLKKIDRCINTLRSFKMDNILSIAKSFKLGSRDVLYRSLGTSPEIELKRECHDNQ